MTRGYCDWHYHYHHSSTLSRFKNKPKKSPIRVEPKQKSNSEHGVIGSCRSAATQHSRDEKSAAAEPLTWPAADFLCCRPEDLFWEGFMFVCLLDMRCTMTPICLWSPVTSDVWIRDWCLSASGPPAKKEKALLHPLEETNSHCIRDEYLDFTKQFPVYSCFGLLSVLWLFFNHEIN